MRKYRSGWIAASWLNDRLAVGIRGRETVWRWIVAVWHWLLAAFLAWVVIGSLVGAVMDYRRPTARRECGPGQHWVDVGIGMAVDMSCERDRT